MALDRACAILEIKAFDLETRTIRGIAATPTTDRLGDVFEPSGASFAAEIPLLLHHDKERPIGTARLELVGNALHFVATLASVDTPGPLRDRCQETYDCLKAGLYRSVSIGFRALKDGVVRLKDGGLHFLKTEICELSIVSVPANAEAAVLSVRSADAPFLEKRTMTTAEQITELESERATHVAHLEAILKDDTLDELRQKEYDTVQASVTAIDAKLPRLRAFEQTLAATAQPVVPFRAPARQPAAPIWRVKPNVEPGMGFVRYCKALAACQGNRYDAIGYAAGMQSWRDTTPEVELLLRAASNPATTTNVPWAGALVPTVTHLGSEFMALLRNKTVIDKIPGLRRVPFDCQVPAQTGGGTYKWVGEGGQKPVGMLAFTTKSVAHYKISGILTFTLELARSASPDAESTFRDEMVAGISAFKNAQFIDPSVAANAGVNPASITNGVTGIPATSNPLVDIATLLNSFVTANIPLEGVVLIMSESNAFVLSNRRSAMGAPDFPSVSISGGSVSGVPVITSQAAGTNIIAVAPSYILYAEDAGVSIDVSTQASVQMLDNPAAPDATSVFRSFWQENLIGLRAEQFCAWTKGHANAVNMITTTAYVPSLAEAPPI